MRIMNLLMKHVLKLVVFFGFLGLGFYTSWASIANQAGYTEIAWQISHIDFTKHLLQSAYTPLNYFFVVFLERTFHISIGNAWKLTDLFFGGLLATLLTHVFWTSQNVRSYKQLFIPVIMIAGTFGLYYNLTSMTGEGPAVFFAVFGIYWWWKHKFIPAAFLFLLSFFSKYTVFLIGPALALWTIGSWPKFNSPERKKLIVAILLGISVFTIYYGMKNWRDLTEQSVYSGSFSVQTLLETRLREHLPRFTLALFLLAPIATVFALVFPQPFNLFWLASLSSLLMLNTRYFDWYFPVEIIPFLLLYLFSHPKFMQLHPLRIGMIQLVFTVVLFMQLPLSMGLKTIIPRHITKYDSFAIENEIRKDYHGGKIAFYQNVRTDFPLPAYDVAYLDPAWDFVLEDTEYAVLPVGPVSSRLTDFENCRFIYHTYIGQAMIYKVTCAKN